jgi:hypothetical protein
MTARQFQEVAMKMSGILLVAAALLLVPALAGAQATCGIGYLQFVPAGTCNLPDGYTGSQYSATLTTINCSEIDFGGGGGGFGGGCSVFFGSTELNAIGLQVNPAGIGSGNAVVTGMPNMAGVFPFTITASDINANCMTTCTGTITITVPITSVPPQYLPPGGYTYNGGTTVGTAPGEQYDLPGGSLGNSSSTYYTPGGADDGSSSSDGNSCFVATSAGGSLLGAGALAALALVGFFTLRRS